jgi:hypothetical protein
MSIKIPSSEVVRDREIARRLALEYFDRFFYRIVYIGEVSLWISRGYNLRETEALLEELVLEGRIRLASSTELLHFGCRRGYVRADVKLLPSKT